MHSLLLLEFKHPINMDENEEYEMFFSVEYHCKIRRQSNPDMIHNINPQANELRAILVPI